MTGDWRPARSSAEPEHATLQGRSNRGDMRKIELNRVARDAFLADRRLGILTVRDEQGAPLGTPLWYGWDGIELEMFAERGAAVVLRIEKDARASVLVTNIPPEPASWVSFEGHVEIDPGGGQAAAARLSARYLVDDGSVAANLRRLERLDLVRLRFVPERIQSYAEFD